MPDAEKQIPTKPGWYLAKWRESGEQEPVKVAQHAGELQGRFAEYGWQPLRFAEWGKCIDDVLADLTALIAERDRLQAELDTERSVTDRACAAADEAALERDQHYAEVAALRSALTEAGVTPDVEGVRMLVDERDRLRTCAEKVNAVRNSIIGTQGFHFSRHAYPLVAALDEAGVEGESYESVRLKAEEELRVLRNAIRADERARAERDIAAAIDTTIKAVRTAQAMQRTTDVNDTDGFVAVLDDVALNLERERDKIAASDYPKAETDKHDEAAQTRAMLLKTADDFAYRELDALRSTLTEAGVTPNVEGVQVLVKAAAERARLYRDLAAIRNKTTDEQTLVLADAALDAADYRRASAEREADPIFKQIKTLAERTIDSVEKHDTAIRQDERTRTIRGIMEYLRRVAEEYIAAMPSFTSLDRVKLAAAATALRVAADDYLNGDRGTAG